MQLSFRLLTLISGVIGLLLCWSCSDSSPENGGEHPSRIVPLRPLIYTEYPDLTPEAAAVRERRLMRQLLEGSSSSGHWGHLDTQVSLTLPTLDSPEALGRAIFDALVNQNEVLWEHVFIHPQDYSALVHISLEPAKRFVDELQGKSQKLWTAFRQQEDSEIREGGLAALFHYEGLILGRGRTVHGPLAKKDEDVVQYWGNTLQMRFQDTDLVLGLAVPKIVHVQPSQRNSTMTLAVASEIQMDSKLELIQRLGLHLKPELLRSREYAYPLKVGNFWRYQRTFESESLQNSAQEWETEVLLDASEVVLEVTSVERYETLRLVQLTRSYNNQRLSSYTDYWLITPRQIWPCPSACRTNIQNLSALIGFLEYQSPIFQFPLRPGQSWHQAGRHSQGNEGTFHVDDDWHLVEVPAGRFHATARISSRVLVPQVDLPIRHRYEQRFLAPQKGVVKRVLSGEERDGSKVTIEEELIDYRIIP